MILLIKSLILIICIFFTIALTLDIVGNRNDPSDVPFLSVVFVSFIWSLFYYLNNYYI